MVKFTCQLDWVRRFLYVGKHYSGYVCKCFGKKVIFKLVDWIKQVALPNVGGYHPIRHRPNKTEELTLPPTSKKVFLSDSLWTGTLFHSPTFTLGLKHLLFLGVELASTETGTVPSALQGLQAFGLKLNHQLSWISSLSIHPADLQTCHPPKSHQLILYNKFTYLYKYILSVLFLSGKSWWLHQNILNPRWRNGLAWNGIYCVLILYIQSHCLLSCPVLGFSRLDNK